eukprot:CAMPEP_0113614936 /NCGR_PEP_ID=MMETSP0017_2-20120614/7432_1 /TAXON_ID=2856 /ORGANISM="Cylindrotheca closterium" /LENGTH=295 /DNA_ID=CAMNT_0000524137 /DNA_START=15 /DNA_END=899 /DNA_ORIENTATION=- /assembly_acc=CAM_ASM_000147
MTVIEEDEESVSESKSELEEQANRDARLGEHLVGLNQPSTVVEDDEESLGSTDLFDPPKSALARSKPLLAAAIKAREQADELEKEEQIKRNAMVKDAQSNDPSEKWSVEETVYGFHLRDMNQPITINEEDEDSLGSTELFDAPKSALAKSKPLLAAAIKAREQADQLEQEDKVKRKVSLGEHLDGMNQPSTISEDDEDSLGSGDLFDAPKSALAKSKPLLAAAIKAREQADELERVEPAKPMTVIEEDEESVSESKSELEEQTNHNVMLGEHLVGLNQPISAMEEDEDSLGSTEL